MAWAAVRSMAMVLLLLIIIVTPAVGVCNCSMFCCTLLFVHSSIAIILVGKRELVALLNFSSWCLEMVEWLFLAVPKGCLRFVIVVFPDHTHLLFYWPFQGSISFVDFIIIICVCLCHTVMSVSCSLMVTCWEWAGLWAFMYGCFLVFLSLSHAVAGSVVVLDCIKS